MTIDWYKLQSVALKAMESIIAGTAPNVGVKEDAYVSSGVVRLFAYYTMYRKDLVGYDPIVAGITCTQTAGGILVRGDFCGEETGTLVLEEFSTDMVVEATYEKVEEAILRIAFRMCQSVEKLNEILKSGGVKLPS